jgi:hypothetical protein
MRSKEEQKNGLKIVRPYIKNILAIIYKHKTQKTYIFLLHLYYNYTNDSFQIVFFITTN